MTKISVILAIAIMVVPCVALAGTNLIDDPGFEDKGQAGWLDNDFGPQYVRDYNSTEERHSGNQSLKLEATGKYDDANKWEMSGAKQIFPVTPGDVIKGGAWLKCKNLGKVEAYVECKWLDADKQELGSGIGTVHKTTGSGDWEYQDLGMWTEAERTAPAKAAYVDFRLNLLSAGFADTATGMVWWDDVKFEIVPKVSK